MAYLTPRKLSTLAAETFVDDLLLSSHIFFKFHCVWNVELSLTAITKYDLNPQENGIIEIEQLMRRLLKNCKKEHLRSICEVLRTTDHFCFSGATLLQLYYDTEICCRGRHYNILSMMLDIGKTFNNIEKLVFDFSRNFGSSFIQSDFLKLVPNLKVFKGMFIDVEDDFYLSSLREFCPDIVDLKLLVKEGYSSERLSEFFFNGKSLKYIRKSYVKLENIKLSFPKLEYFSMNNVTSKQYDFFKMFFHYYNKVHINVQLDYGFVPVMVSWFDEVLSHSVVINPELKVKQCELNLYDLLLPFCETNLDKWKNLKCLVFSVGISFKQTICKPFLIGIKLQSLLHKQSNIRELCIKVVGSVTEDEISGMLHSSFKIIGSRLQELKIIGSSHHFVTHKSLIKLINFCPNLVNLVLDGCLIVKYSKDLKVIKLNRLKSLKILWSDKQIDNECCQVSIDLIRKCPNIQFLYLTVNIDLLVSLIQTKFGYYLQTLIIYFHSNKSCDGIQYLKQILPSLPNLKELVVNERYYKDTCQCFESDHEDECICEDLVDSIYSAVKRYVCNTEVSMRYYDLEDSLVML